METLSQQQNIQISTLINTFLYLVFEALFFSRSDSHTHNKLSSLGQQARQPRVYSHLLQREGTETPKNFMYFPSLTTSKPQQSLNDTYVHILMWGGGVQVAPQISLASGGTRQRMERKKRKGKIQQSPHELLYRITVLYWYSSISTRCLKRQVKPPCFAFLQRQSLPQSHSNKEFPAAKVNFSSQNFSKKAFESYRYRIALLITWKFQNHCFI